MDSSPRFIPDQLEPTSFQGSPPPRRRRPARTAFKDPPVDGKFNWPFEDKETDPNYSPRISPTMALPDAFLSRAFGASPLLFQHAETPSPGNCDETSATDRVKNMDARLSELVKVFGSEDPHPRNRAIWPPLPVGPPPPQATVDPPIRKQSAWNTTHPGLPKVDQSR